MIRPDVEIPAAKIDTTDPTGYPYGKAQNITTPGDGTGTPLIAEWLNDVWGAFYALLDDAGLTASGTAEQVGNSQILDAVVGVIARRLTFRLALGVYTGLNSGSLAGAGNGRGLAFSSDGTKVYYAAGGDANTVNEYPLSTAWDISSIGSLSHSENVESEVGAASTYTVQDIAVSSDGTKLYVLAYGVIYSYTMSTPWDLSTVSYDSVSVSVGLGSSKGLSFSDDGGFAYVTSIGPGVIYYYELTTPWDLSTLNTSALGSLSTNSVESSPTTVVFNSTGTRALVNGSGSRLFREVELATPWDISTGVFNGETLDSSSEETDASAIFVDPTGTKAYLVGQANDTIYQYRVGLTL